MISEYLEMCGRRAVGVKSTAPAAFQTNDEASAEGLAPLDLVVASLNVPDQTAVL